MQNQTNLPEWQVPKNWQKIKLGDVFEMKYGEGLVAKNRKKGEFPVYGSSGIVDFNLEPLIYKEGLIIGRKGNVGNVYFSEKPFFPIDTVYYVDSLKIPGYLKFFYYFLKRIPFKRIGSDVGVPGLNRDLAYGLNIVIPKDPIVQEKIANLLSAFDDKIELDNKIAKTLEDMAQTIFKEWFVNKQNVNNSIIKDITFVKTGNRPEKLNDIKDKSHSVPVYGANEIMGYTSKTLYNTRIIITGRVGTIGKIFIVNEPSWPSDNVLILIPKNNDYFYFLYFLAKRINYLSLNRGSSQPLIAQSDIENYLIYLPDQTKVKRFNSLVSNLFVLKKIKENENKKLVALRDLLLPKLMKGEIKL